MKRYNQFQSRPHVNKKPKLDICYGNRSVSSSSKTNALPANNKPHENDAEALWGADDDDEVIFLASQVAEQIEQCSQQVIANPPGFGEITFNTFSRGVSSSTQVVRQSENIFTNFLDEGDDAFANIGECIENPRSENGKQKGAKNDAFKSPQLVGKSIANKHKSAKEPNPNISIRNEAKEAQVAYLMKRLESLKNENEQLSKDVTEFNDKMQTKEGEVSMLRHELRHIKQINDNLRLEKMKENDSIKKEWQDKIEELEKLLKAQQTELEFKNIEISNLKVKKLNETQRAMDTSAFELKKDYHSLSALHNLHLPVDFQQKLNISQHIPDEIFVKSREGSSSFRENVFRRHLEELQSALAQFHSNRILGAKFVNNLSEKVLETCKATIVELNHYIQDLEFPKYRDTNSNVEYKFLCQEWREPLICTMHRPPRGSIYQEHSLFPNEKAVVVRRVVAALALICKYLEPVRKGVLVEKVQEYTLMQILVGTINTIGYSKEIFNHTGLIESLGTLLNSFICSPIEDRSLISQYLKNLIFCRPTIRPLLEISRYLCNISSQEESTSLLNSFCTKSNEGCFFINEYYKIFLFSPESCPLQVYGALLEVALPQCQIFLQHQVDALIEICYNHARFLRNSFERLAHWVVTSPSESPCDCYAKSATSLVVLLHLTLNQWISSPKSIDIKKISKISRVGSLVLCDIFHTNYRREVLQNGGSAIKHRLHIIYDWLSEHQNLFRFKEPHVNALKFIQLLHIMADPLKNHEDLSNKEFAGDGNAIWEEVFHNFI